MAQTGIHYENKKVVMGDNHVDIQCRSMVRVH